MDLSVLQKGLDLKTGKIIPAKPLEGERVVELETAKIQPDPQQPRKTFDPVKLQELAEDIKQNGLIQPIIVRMSGVGEYIVIAGERRLKAAQMLNQAKIKAIIAKDYSDEQVGYIQMAENMKRDDLRFYEMAEFIIGRIDAGEKQSTVADKLGMSKSELNRYMTWKDAPDFLKDAKEKFNSIRPFADLVALAKEHLVEVQDYIKSKEDFVTRANVKDLRKSIEEPEIQIQEKQENAAAVITGEVPDENVTDSESLENREDEAAENESAVSEEEFSVDAGNDENDDSESETAVVSDDNEDSLNEKGDVADADLSNADDDIDHGFAAVSDETESDALSELNTEPKQERYKKPVIWGSVDGREAELLYREIPSADGLVKVRYEDGFEDEVLAEEFALNRICEA
ncbi:ParB/RepB/Spo0J family partition protein [Succinatimonas hippei]|uniref:ParB/RepB/Spo0J family partition protein n=1 Tax=Succinatimonas hippei TaxID=626938 RepID=UPI0020131E30|nr:ParB/RepB/Spo0J family partition protein [Succinatimonas hippei]MCL1602447.1 ParB/RepB/Spo0J family partition protein [Succinatimonas hippei]